MTAAKRTYWLDALKFISMIVVFLCHFRMAFFYDKFRTIDCYGISFPNYLFNGNLAVCLFLLISCFLFVDKAQKNSLGLDDVYGLLKKRFFRLWIPAIVVNMLIFILYILHLFFNVGAYSDNVPYVNDWFAYSNTIKAFGSMIWADVNICLFQNGNNPPLWCYHLLFFLPIITFIIVKTIEIKKITFLSVVILPVLLLHNSYYAVIPLSVIITRLSKCDRKFRAIVRLLYIIGIILCVVLDTIKTNNNIEVISNYTVALNICLATSILGLFEMFKERNVLDYNLFSLLNKISFSIYLLHMPIICSIGFCMYKNGCNTLLTFTVVTLVLVFVSIPFHLFVEKKMTQKILKYFETR